MNDVKSIETLEAIDIIRCGGSLILTNYVEGKRNYALYVATQFATTKAMALINEYNTKGVKLALSSELYNNINADAENSAIQLSLKTAMQAYKEITLVETVNGGILIKYALEEASVDISRLASLYSSGVICELDEKSINDILSKGVKLFDIVKLREYRDNHDSITSKVSLQPITTLYGTFTVVGFHNDIDEQEIVAIIKGDIKNEKSVLTRIHSQCITGDVFSSLRCDCGDQLHSAMRAIDELGVGVVLYLFQEGRGIGLLNKIKAYNLQDKGLDTVEANIELGFADDLRDYSFAAQVLRKLGVTNIKLLSNNPRKFDGLADAGITIDERVSIECEIHDDNKKYMQTKKDKLGHTLNI